MAFWPLALAVLLGCRPSPCSAAGSNRVSFYRGVNLTSWRAGELSAEDARLSLDQLAKTGVDTVAVVQTWYMEKADSGEVFPHPSKSPTEKDLRSVIRQAKKRGLRTMLKLHVDVLTGDWRGKVDPKDPDRWFESYGAFAGSMAEIAAEEGCVMLIMGCELKSISGKRHQKRWQGLIGHLRARFKGLTSYAANFDEYQTVSFWDKVDWLGVNAYFPLLRKDSTSRCQKDLVAAWSEFDANGGKRHWLADLQAFHAKHKKPILFSEAGYMSRESAPVRPWDYSGECVYDGELQAACYRALIDATARKDWLGGILWWDWEPKPLSDAKGRCSYSPQGKPAMRVLEGWKGHDFVGPR